MASVPKRRCARGQNCYHVRVLGLSEAVVLRAAQDGICDKCKEAESNADFEGHQHAPSVKHEAVKAGKDPLKARLVVLKRNLVAQMLGVSGGFQRAVEEIRTWWQIDNPPTQLPPSSDEILRPPGVDEQANPEDLYAMWPNHPHLIPLLPGWETRPGEVYENLKMRWEFDLKHALYSAGVPEEHLEGGQPALPWYRFAAACVLYRPPVEEADAFAEYGGLSALPVEEGEEEPMLTVVTPHHLKERQKRAVIRKALDEFVLARLWEHRRELPEDLREA